MLGVLQTHKAISRAQEQGLDLVEINPKANPPVCKILDYGKYKYDEKKKKRETKRKQSVVEVKEVKLRPKTDDHDLEFKARAARKFLEAGNKVKFTVRFRGREITHPQKAREQLDWIVKQCTDIANVEVRPSMEGRTMTMIVSPKPAVLQALASARAAAEKERKDAELARLAAKGRRSLSGGRASAPGAPQSDPGDAEPAQDGPAAKDAGNGGQAAKGKGKGKDAAKAKGKDAGGKGKGPKGAKGGGRSKAKGGNKNAQQARSD